MSIPVHFGFAGSLNDFLRQEFRGKSFAYACPATATAKDAVEGVGVPQVEVAALRVNGSWAPFAQPLRAGDRLEVFPRWEYPALPPGYALHRPLPEVTAFILDVHLGKLARLLRMLGFDCRYERDYADDRIAAIAAAEGRAVLTRDIPLLKRKVLDWGYWLRSQHPKSNWPKCSAASASQANYRPFTALPRLQRPPGSRRQMPRGRRTGAPETRVCFEEFYRCTVCRRVY
jgi:uncharacterized protein with PIN domain/sulfur carrier protein ThiS